MKTAVVVLLCVFFMGGSEACSCAFAHYQDQFCKAAFVVKARVISSQYIYQPTEPPAIETTTAPTAAPSSSVFDQQNELLWDETQPEVPHEPPRRPPAGMMGGRLPPIGLSDFPGHRHMPLDAQTDRRPIRFEYTVQVEKVFKGNNYVVEKELAKIYTQPNDGLCGLTDLTKGVSYVITGTFYDNKLSIGSCNWVTPYRSLTRIQKRGVKLVYKQKCGECQIGTCYESSCKFAQSDDMCMFNMAHMGNSCEGKHSYCSRNKKVCKWQRNRDYKQCLSEMAEPSEGRHRFMP